MVLRHSPSRRWQRTSGEPFECSEPPTALVLVRWSWVGRGLRTGQCVPVERNRAYTKLRYAFLALVAFEIFSLASYTYLLQQTTADYGRLRQVMMEVVGNCFLPL